MQIVPLQAIPNQQFQVTFESTLFNITLKTILDRIYATILINNVVVVSGVLCVPGFQILPSRYLEGVTGNFAFVTNNDEYPSSDQFGITQFLLYATAAELASSRGTYAII